MTSRLRTGALLLAGAGALALGAALTVPGSRPPDTIAAVVDRILPGSTVRLRTRSAGGEHLAIRLGPAQDVPAGATKLQAQFAYNEIGWRARMATLTDPDVLRYNLTTAAGSVPTAAFDDFHGGALPPSPDARTRRVALIRPDLARRQAESNIRVLESALPHGAVVASKVSILPLEPSRNRYAVEIDVTVATASVLAKWCGDVVDGLATGLDYSESSDDEGLAVIVTAPGGQPLVGEWSTSHPRIGAVQFAASAPDIQPVTVHFPDLTGGPPTATMALSAPVTVRAGATSGAAHPG